MRTRPPKGATGLPKKKKNGRPPLYKEEYNKKAERLVSITGANDVQVGEYFGVSGQTISNWKVAYPEFLEALKKGRLASSSGKVVRSLLQTAVGYEYDEVHEEFILIDGAKCIEVAGVDEEGKPRKKMVEGTKTKIVHKRVQPHVMAMMFWLQNKLPEEWKNVQKQMVEGKVEHDHQHTVKLDPKQYSRQELEELRELILKGRPQAGADVGRSGNGFGIRQPVPLRLPAMARG